MYCLYRLDVIIPGATIKPQSQHNYISGRHRAIRLHNNWRTSSKDVTTGRRRCHLGQTTQGWEHRQRKFLAHADYCTHSQVSLYADITAYLKCKVIVVLTAQSVFTQILQLTWSVKWLLYSQPSQSLHIYFSLVEVSSDCCTHRPSQSLFRHYSWHELKNYSSTHIPESLYRPYNWLKVSNNYCTHIPVSLYTDITADL